MPPEAMLPVTVIFLGLVQAFVKGDEPTKLEIQSSNVALTAVVNKYSTSFRYAEEILLIMAVGNAGMGMRRRAKDKEPKTVETSNRGRSRNEGIRKEPASAGLSGPAQ